MIAGEEVEVKGSQYRDSRKVSRKVLPALALALALAFAECLMGFRNANFLRERATTV